VCQNQCTPIAACGAKDGVHIVAEAAIEPLGFVVASEVAGYFVNSGLYGVFYNSIIAFGDFGYLVFVDRIFELGWS